ncbi:ABCB family ABC transporter ATP-binding protein/permease [Aquisalinus flavus]|uniref:ABCB family ABC transporter ATP-binding protein/permease n=1 Tax=Aquisalinus flavus TaxID=1526572 RepID=UPI00165FAD13|nr:ABC transporter ATP-binding protein/permease [Aquisalinus flavus]MBD0427027.1 ABC transporter ATP-binding protein/permease [Aquisalinus flavus]UNE46853.1 ABC transporter ATP-binding protein/permease [Aquisalinus flavus]
MPRGSHRQYGLHDGEASSLKEQLASVRALLPHLWPKDKPSYKLRVIAAFIVILLGQVVSLGAPILLEEVVNGLDQSNPAVIAVATITSLVVGYGIFRLLSVAVPQLREFLFARVGQNAQREVAIDVFRHLHALSLRFHLERRTGGLSRIIERGIRSIDFLFRFLLFNIIPTFIQLGIIAVLFSIRYDPVYAVIAAVTVIVYVWFTVASTEWRLKFRREMNQQDTEANTRAVDSLLNYETVKYFNNERWEADRYNDAMAKYQEAAIRSNNSLAIVNIGQSLIFNAGIVAILILATRAIAAGEMEVGVITGISLIMMQLYQPLNILGFAYREIKQSMIDMEKMFSLQKVEPEVEDRPDARPLAVDGAAIVFDNVHFRYEEDRPILKGVSFAAQPGEKIAIVGHSGAGKSTISRILYRFYDIDEGSVTIDGQDIREVTQDSLRAAIGMVPQDTVLFNETIGYNIAYARPGATQTQIEQAAQMAQIHDFVAGLPKGYDTVVGERGLKLSGGEKQRVAIARTILKNPPILILDEATSALDSVTEQGIQTALRNVAESRTTLVIAHRLSTIIDADRILVMDDGKIIEQGTHAELLTKGGDYAELWQRQQEDRQAAE